MIKVYGMDSCPDCFFVKDQIKGREKEFEYVDISKSTKNLKEFLKLRDNNGLFDYSKTIGAIGIPCFVLEDGTATLDPKFVGLETLKDHSCSLEDHLIGKKGC